MPSFCEDCGRGVDGEIVGRNQHAGGDEGHDGHESFDQHGAVADEQDVPFIADHLGRGAGADDGMESREGAAGDGDEDKGEDRARDDRAAAVDIRGERGHLKVRVDHDDAERQHDDGADLQIGGEIIAGAEQHPDRQDRGDESVDGDDDGNLFLA